MRGMKSLAELLAGIAILCMTALGAPAQSPPREGAQQFASLGDFKLRSGETIRDFQIGYRTLGRLNSVKSNTISGRWPFGTSRARNGIDGTPICTLPERSLRTDSVGIGKTTSRRSRTPLLACVRLG